MQDFKDRIMTIDFPEKGLTYPSIRAIMGTRELLTPHLRQLMMEGKLESYDDGGTIRYRPTGWSIEDGWYRQRRDTRVDCIVEVRDGRIGPHFDWLTVWMLEHMPDGNHYSHERVYVFTAEEMKALLPKESNTGKVKASQLRIRTKAGGQEDAPGPMLQYGDRVEILETKTFVGGQSWYRIGEDRWVISGWIQR